VDVWEVPVAVHSWVEVWKQGMAIGKGVGGNKKCPHMLVGIEGSHTSVVARVVGYDAW
jgi:hypothetical protein